MPRNLFLRLTAGTALVFLVVWGETARAEEPTAEKPAQEAPVVQKPSDEAIRKWLAELGSDGYPIREEATRQLVQAGEQAIAGLVSAATEGSVEVSCRAVRILRTIFHTDDEAAVDAAEAALESLLASSNRPAARRAAAALNARPAVRQNRAIGRIRAMGGMVVPMQLANGTVFLPNGEAQISEVRILKHWKGGDAGLADLKRLTGLKSVYVIDGANVSEDALKELKKELPDITIVHRGPALLGITGDSHETEKGCPIVFVKEDSPAERAGLESGDLIVRFEGRQVKSFDALIEETKKKNGGDKVQLEIVRDGKTLLKDVILGGWEEKK